MKINHQSKSLPTTRFFEKQRVLDLVERNPQETEVMGELNFSSIPIYQAELLFWHCTSQLISIDQILSLSEREAKIFENDFILKLIRYNVISFERARALPIDKIDQIDSIYNMVALNELSMEEVDEIEDYFFASDDQIDYLLTHRFITVEKLESLSENQLGNLRRISELITNELISLDEVIQLKSNELERLHRLFSLIYRKEMTAKEALSCSDEEFNLLRSDAIQTLIFQKRIPVQHFRDLINSTFSFTT